MLCVESTPKEVDSALHIVSTPESSPHAQSANPIKIDELLVLLSPVEILVATLASYGMSNRAIAARMGINVRTVEMRLRVVYKILGIIRRTQLVSVFSPQNLVPAVQKISLMNGMRNYDRYKALYAAHMHVGNATGREIAKKILSIQNSESITTRKILRFCNVTI